PALAVQFLASPAASLSPQFSPSISVCLFQALAMQYTIRDTRQTKKHPGAITIRDGRFNVESELQWIITDDALINEILGGDFGEDPRERESYGEKKLQEILDPVLKATETAGEEDDSGVFGAGCEGRRD
ncbi:hypothetical protein U1Q18_012729, partial [Sarracenia purpurea var. burkii]